LLVQFSYKFVKYFIILILKDRDKNILICIASEGVGVQSSKFCQQNIIQVWRSSESKIGVSQELLPVPLSQKTMGLCAISKNFP